MKKYIGNIIVNSPNHKVDECFNKCMSIENIDITIPTIIIGLDNAKKLIVDFNILKKEYNDGMLWWTFSKNERRNDHDSDISAFRDYCINNILGNIKYSLINYIDLSYNKAKRCLNYIYGNSRKYYYIDNGKFVFVYDYERDKKVRYIYGFSLSTCSFFGISAKKVVSIIEKNPNNIRIKNFYNIPNNIRRVVNDDIPSEMVLLEYFS